MVEAHVRLTFRQSITKLLCHTNWEHIVLNSFNTAAKLVKQSVTNVMKL